MGPREGETHSLHQEKLSQCHLLNVEETSVTELEKETREIISSTLLPPELMPLCHSTQQTSLPFQSLP